MGGEVLGQFGSGLVVCGRRDERDDALGPPRRSGDGSVVVYED